MSQQGELRQLGSHRMLCGDALDRSSFDRLLGDELADLVLTDPPYNVKIDGNVCGSGAIKHREFAVASGEMTKQQLTRLRGQRVSEV